MTFLSALPWIAVAVASLAILIATVRLVPPARRSLGDQGEELGARRRLRLVRGGVDDSNGDGGRAA